MTIKSLYLISALPLIQIDVEIDLATSRTAACIYYKNQKWIIIVWYNSHVRFLEEKALSYETIF